MGHLGWSEYQYYTCSPEGFFYACQGYFSKRKQEESWHRMNAFIIFKSMGGKQKLEDIWPMGGEKSEKVTQVIDPELYREIMARATGHPKKEK